MDEASRWRLPGALLRQDLGRRPLKRIKRCALPPNPSSISDPLSSSLFPSTLKSITRVLHAAVDLGHRLNQGEVKEEQLVFFFVQVEAIEQEGSESGASRRSLPPVIAGVSSISSNSGNHRILRSYYQLQGNHAHLWNTLLHHFDIYSEILIIG
jgi:hypothetical protein